jgi:hypothetical protein
MLGTGSGVSVTFDVAATAEFVLSVVLVAVESATEGVTMVLLAAVELPVVEMLVLGGMVLLSVVFGGIALVAVSVEDAAILVPLEEVDVLGMVVVVAKVGNSPDMPLRVKFAE